MKKNPNLHFKKCFQGAVHMKTVFPLLPCLTGEIHIISSHSYVKCFPGCVRFNFGGMLGGKMLGETNIRNGWHKLDEKLLSSVSHDHIRSWHSHFFFGRSSASPRDGKATKYLDNAVFTNLKHYTKTKKETLLVDTRKKWHMVVQFNARNISSWFLDKELAFK